MACECYTVGGPFIGADPDCPAHGVDGYASRLEAAESKISELQQQVDGLVREVTELRESNAALLRERALLKIHAARRRD